MNVSPDLTPRELVQIRRLSVEVVLARSQPSDTHVASVLHDANEVYGFIVGGNLPAIETETQRG